MDTPSWKLAEKIVAKLVHEELLTQKDAKKILPKLAEGKLKAEDWRPPFELSVPKNAKP